MVVIIPGMDEGVELEVEGTELPLGVSIITVVAGPVSPLLV